MKIILIKAAIVFFLFIVAFQFTVGKVLNNFKTNLHTIQTRENRDQFKEKVKDEMRKGIEKDKYFKDDERELISKFLKKIFKELDLIENKN